MVIWSMFWMRMEMLLDKKSRMMKPINGLLVKIRIVFWDYERAGVWQKDEREEAAIYGCQPGDFKYVDQNGDGIMNNKDKVFQGYTTPRFRWTLRNEWTYKNLSLSLSYILI
mgnify:CR=1 FL=1